MDPAGGGAHPLQFLELEDADKTSNNVPEKCLKFTEKKDMFPRFPLSAGCFDCFPMKMIARLRHNNYSFL